MITELINAVSPKSIFNFIRSRNSSFREITEDLSYIIEKEPRLTDLIKIGEIAYADTDVLMVFSCLYNGELSSRSARKNQFEIAKKALKENFKDGAVFVFYDQIGRFRFSFIRRNYGDKNQKYTPWKRYTYFVEPDAKSNRTFIERIGTCHFNSLDAIQQAFSVEKLTKDFYKELSDWYFWAIKNVSFPNDVTDDADDEKYNSENIIRLITRLIFVWFLKQKGLIRNELFDQDALSKVLVNFDAESETQNNYYRAILQNLFFATLNQEIDKRDFAEDKGFVKNRDNFAIKNLYRYEKEFKNGTVQVLELFCQIPFLNGGLFECLDRKEKDGKVYDWDGFSRNSKYQAKIANALFFAKESKVDLSGEYNDKKMKAVKVAGIIEILNRYNFTVEENTPVEVEVALDPELLGKVFENLLGAFNPETQETARKQTGSFYTPREIVNYMVDESLIAYFQTKVPDLKEETLRLLFSYDDEEAVIDDFQRESLIQAAFDCKILDPACGSGAFPMGILQQMVHLLKKLDPDNTNWNNVVMAQAMKDFEKSDKLSEEDKEGQLGEIEKTFDDGLNYPDYARKLHLIEHCIYGVDIQSIAVQISKLRFFISLVCEQRRNAEDTKNFGIRPLPNLETKFVAANTLIGLEKTEEDLELFNDDLIKTLIDKLQHVRHRQFLVTKATEKKRLRDKDQKLRAEIENEVTKLYVKHNDDNKAFYERQKVLAEKELELIDKTIERSSVSTNIFGEHITKTYKPNDKRKKELQDAIKISSKKIEESSAYSRLEVVVGLAKQLTSWNPYDQNKHSDFFDPEWMFGLEKQGEGYFDVVIGNPPYVSAIGLNKETRLQLANSKEYSTLYQKWDIYIAFVEKGIRLLGNGINCMIVPYPVMNQMYAKKLREFILNQNDLIEITNLSGNKVFEEATVTNCILFVKNIKTENDKIRISKLEDKRISVSTVVMKQDVVKDANSFVWDISQKENLNFNGHGYMTIGDYCFLSKGMVLNADEKKAKGLFVKDDLISEFETETNLKRYIEAKNIDKYQIKNVHYLEWNTKRVPSLISRPTFPELYERPKLIVSKIGRIKATYDESNIYCDQTIRVLILWNELHGVHNKSIESSIKRYHKSGRLELEKNSTQINLKFILALLNSTLINFVLDQIRGIGNIDINPEYLRNLPVPPVNTKTQLLLVKIIDEILDIKNNDIKNDISKLEQSLDNLIYRLYTLTYTEVKVIDLDFESKLSEEEYNAINI